MSSADSGKCIAQILEMYKHVNVIDAWDMERNVKVQHLSGNHKPLRNTIESNICVIYSILSMDSYFWYLLQCSYIKRKPTNLELLLSFLTVNSWSMNILAEEWELTFLTTKRHMQSLNPAAIRRLCFLDRFLMAS